MDLPDLETVDEDALDQQVLNADQQAALVAAVNDDADAGRRVSAYSVMSGTTAKTSFSQEEVGELDHEIMMDDLPRLAATVDDLVNLMVPSDPRTRLLIWKEIRTPGSRHSKLYNNRVRALDVHRPSFGSQEYISPNIVLRALFGVQSVQDLTEGFWRPDDIIYKINLAQMLRHLVVITTDSAEDTQDRFDALGSLVTYFPSVIAGPEFDPEAVNMCLALQTQLSIARLHAFSSDHGFDALQVVQDTFFETDSDDDYVYRHSGALHMMSLSNAKTSMLANSINDLVNSIKAPVDPASGLTLPAALGTLRVQYPWDEFLERILRYYEHRKTQLDGRIHAAGGVDRIVQGLVNEVQRTHDAKAAELMRRSLTGPGNTPKKGFGKRGIAALKARIERLSGQTAPAPTPAVTAQTNENALDAGETLQSEQAPPASTAPMAQMTDPNLQDQPIMQNDEWNAFEDDALERQAAQQTAQSTLAQLSQFQDMQRKNFNAAQSKKRTFTDRQANAQRISFEDSQPSQAPPGEGSEFYVPGRSSAPGPYHVTSARQAIKRPFATVEDADDDENEDFEPTQDSGFETDPRDPAAADERRRLAPVAKARTVEPSGPGLVNYAYPGSAEGSPAKRQRKNPGASIPSLQPVDPEHYEPPRSSSYAEASILAKRARVMHPVKGTQSRTAWTLEESERLSELIVEHGHSGISWALLKKIDEADGDLAVLGHRSAEDLRFRARNMKMQYLK